LTLTNASLHPAGVIGGWGSAARDREASRIVRSRKETISAMPAYEISPVGLGPDMAITFNDAEAAAVDLAFSILGRYRLEGLSLAPSTRDVSTPVSPSGRQSAHHIRISGWI
jgi:hypothetical protein